MPRKAKELSSLEVRRLTRPGRWSVGGVDGLALQVTQSGSQSWVLRFRIGGRQREMGLGSFPTVTLAAARDKARQLRSQCVMAVIPSRWCRRGDSAAFAERQTQKTFSEVAAQYIAQHEKSWKNAKHQAQWAATLRTYAEPSIGKLLVRDIRPAHVISVLEPIWTTKTETATRVRSRIELVLDYAAARGFREGLNPARWKGNLDAALPNASKVAPVRHHAAVGVKDVAVVHEAPELARRRWRARSRVRGADGRSLGRGSRSHLVGGRLEGSALDDSGGADEVWARASSASVEARDEAAALLAWGSAAGGLRVSRGCAGRFPT